MAVGDAARALDPIVETHGMPDRNAIEPPAPPEELRDVFVPQIRRQTRIDPGDIAVHAVKEIHADAAQQRIQDRLVDFRRSKGGGERRDVFVRAGFGLCRQATGVQGECGLEVPMAQIQLARDHQRAPQFGYGLLQRKLRTLVEPFRHHHFGAGANRRSLAVSFSVSFSFPWPSISISTRTNACDAALTTTAPKRNGRVK